MDVNQEQESLLVLDKKDGKKVKAVSGVDEQGNLKTVPPKKQNEQDFLKIDKHSNVLENFFSNLARQFKDPTHFDFFKVKSSAVENVAPVIESMANGQNYSATDEMLKDYLVNPADYAKQQSQEQKTETPKQGYQPIDESRIDWDNLKQFGITRDMLEKTKSLEPMLNFQKSPVLLPIAANFEAFKINTDARLAFRETPDGRVILDIHGIQKQIELDKPFYGNNFTLEDKQNLSQYGNLGRVIDMKIPNNPESIPVYLSVDKLTNELVACRADKIKIPNEIKGVTLDETQKATLEQGGAIYVEGMTSKGGKEFNATLQVNAEKRGIEFRFDGTQKVTQNQKQSNTEQKPRQSNLDENGNVRIPNKLGGVVLSDKEQNTLKEGGTIYVKGLIDQKGQEYNAYVKVSPEEQKLRFYRWNPNKKEGVTPDNASKTQVAVNSQGKTNEATKQSNAPLKKEQTQPTEKQAEQQQQKPRGRKL